jgi:GntR family transcriptional regulator
MWTLPSPPARFRPHEPTSSPPVPSYQPLYGQIKALLVSSLANGEWKPGPMIPASPSWPAASASARAPVRKAIDELATDRLLLRRQGRGTFVASHAEDRNSTRFLRLRAADGSAEAHLSRLIDCRSRCGRGGPAAEALGLDRRASRWSR